MATTPTPATTTLRRQLWGMVLLMLSGAYNLGLWTCRLVQPGADLWSVDSVFRFVCYAVMVSSGVFGQRALLRRLERGPAEGADRN